MAGPGAPPPLARGLAWGLVVGIAYFLAARLGLALAFVGDNVSIVWPAAAVGVFAGHRFGWPAHAAVFAAAALATQATGAAPAAAVAVGLGNAFEAIAAAAILQRFRFDPALRHLRDVALLTTAATFVPALAAATIGAGSLGLAGVIPAPKLAEAWLVWWLGDVMGIAVVAPFLFSVSAPRNVRWLRVSRLLELGGVLVCLVVLTYFVSRSPLPLAWAAFPFLIWAAARFGPAGGASASLVVSLITLWFTSRHEGLFAQWDLHTNLAVLQAFLAVVTFTSSFVGAAVAQIAESEAERARLRASEAAAREREVIREQLLGVLGHDLRNPLAAIRTGIDVMVRQERPEARQRLAERMRGSCARMTRLIEDILDFTRSRLGGGIPTNRAPADLAEICARVVGELETAHPARRFVLSSPVAIVGFWDAERLAQVVSNLVGNAVEHSEGDVRVAVTTSGSDRVTLEVANGGRPIPPELLASLFEPFARGARSGQGLGLGLYIVREIIRAHEGEVSVTSDAERGTVFTVRLPRGAEAGGAGAADAPAAAAPERRALPSV